jgi:hypothetical protein
MFKKRKNRQHKMYQVQMLKTFIMKMEKSRKKFTVEGIQMTLNKF